MYIQGMSSHDSKPLSPVKHKTSRSHSSSSHSSAKKSRRASSSHSSAKKSRRSHSDSSAKKSRRASSASSVSSSRDDNAMILEIVKSEFDDQDYDVQVIGNAKKKIDIRMIDNTNPKKIHENECFKLIMDKHAKMIIIDHLKFPRQDNCMLSGPIILKKLIEIARKLDCDISIDSDASSLTLSNPKKTIVNLAVFKILLDGKSFYNKYGFQSGEYPKELKWNEKLRNQRVRDPEFDIPEDDIEVMEHAFGITINDKTTFVEVADAIKTIIRDREYSDEVALAIKMLVENYFKYLVNYKTTNLEFHS